MTEAIKDMLFDDINEFAMFFYEKDSAEIRAKVLTTFKLKVWYLKTIKVRKDIYMDVLSELYAKKRNSPRIANRDDNIKQLCEVSRWIANYGVGVRYKYWPNGNVSLERLDISNEWDAEG